MATDAILQSKDTDSTPTAQRRARRTAGLLATLAMIFGMTPEAKAERTRIAEMGASNLMNIGGIVLGVVVAILVPVVVVNVAAALAPGYFASLTSLADAFSNLVTGDPLVDGLTPIIGSVLLLVGVMGFLGVAIAFVTIKVRGKAASS